VPPQTGTKTVAALRTARKQERLAPTWTSLPSANGRSGRLPEGKPASVCAPDLLFCDDVSGRSPGVPGEPFRRVNEAVRKQRDRGWGASGAADGERASFGNRRTAWAGARCCFRRGIAKGRVPAAGLQGRSVLVTSHLSARQALRDRRYSNHGYRRASSRSRRGLPARW
jgi:hypothetical protein